MQAVSALQPVCVDRAGARQDSGAGWALAFHDKTVRQRAMTEIERRYSEVCAGLDPAQRRALRPMGRSADGRTIVAGRSMINLSSNDYLGLARHPLLIERASEWAARWGTGSSASRLVCGNLEPFEALEARLARGKGKPAALILGTGFQANAAVLPALLDRQLLGAEPLVYADRLNHASIHLGLRAAGVRQIRYPHNDLDHLETLLARDAGEARPRFIVTETVFSMDGDCVDLDGLVGIAERFGAFLYVDEAHATGVFGRGGFGLAAGYGERVGLVMGTFSKALGSFGAYVACSEGLRDFLVNRCAGLIYSTALPPPVLGAIDAALELLPQLDDERARVLRHGESLRAAFAAAGLDCGASASPIVPVILGEAEACLALGGALEAEGVLAIAIRPPTVPNGTARLRFAASAAHSDEDIATVGALLPRLAAQHKSAA